MTHPDYRDCHILHVDMDAFYASVAVLDDPALRGLPVIVGHAGGRGVVLSATYEARAYGVRSAMPVTAAMRLAPQARVVSPQHERYAHVSAEVMNVFRSITPVVEPLSLDEAFLDVRGAYRLFGDPHDIARMIRARISQEIGITCSVGVSVSKLVAKMASALCKPNGLLVVPASGVLDVIQPLPIERLWGVGATTAATLHKFGITTIADIAHTPIATLQQILGEAHGAALADLAWGRDPRPVVVDAPEKSIGAETTFDRDLSDLEAIRAELLRLSNVVARRLRANDVSSRTITIKIRFEDFTTITRSRTLSDPTDVGHRIYEVATMLFDALRLQRTRIRLVGVRATNLTGMVRNEGLFEDPDEHWSAVERVADAAVNRFGNDAVTSARLLRPWSEESGPTSEDAR